MIPTTYVSTLQAVESSIMDDENECIKTIDLRQDESCISTQRVSVDGPSKIGINRIVRGLKPIKIKSKECERHRNNHKHNTLTSYRDIEYTAAVPAINIYE